MARRNNNRDNSIAHIANLLTSILLYYPEVVTINLDPKTCVVKFTFYLSSLIPEKTLKLFQERLQQSLNAYYYLEKRKAEVYSLAFQPLDFFTAIELQRDIQTLSQQEIALIVALLKEEFGHHLVTEDNDELLIDDSSLHEELIGYMLENIKKTTSNIELIALRDEGKVLVFNK